MFKHKSVRQSGGHIKVLAMISIAALRSCTMTIAALVAVALHLPASTAALAATACCKVTEIATNGQVTALEIDGTRTIAFQVTDAALLRGLKPGAPVYANFDTKQVSLDGKKACCKIVNTGTVAKQPEPAATAAAPKEKPSGTATPSKQTTVEVPKVDVTAAEGSTATAIRGKPATPTTGTKQSATSGTTSSNTAAANAQSEAINPDVILLQTNADLVTRDIGLTAAGEVTFRLVNRGEVGINVSPKSGALTLAQAPPSNPPGPPISIDVWAGTSKISTVYQPSMGGSQSKTFTVPIPSNYSAPKCLETRDLKVVVDPQKQIAELYDDNNVTEADSARPCPDLAIKSIKRHYTGLFNETYRVKVTISNEGNAPSPSTQVWGTSLPGGVWPVTGWPEVTPNHTIPALDPGETTSFKTGGSVLSANHTAVRVVLDRFYEIEESDESNNFQDKQL